MSSFESLVPAHAMLFLKSANAFDRPLQTQEKFADKLTNHDLTDGEIAFLFGAGPSVEAIAIFLAIQRVFGHRDRLELVQRVLIKASNRPSAGVKYANAGRPMFDTPADEGLVNELSRWIDLQMADFADSTCFNLR